MKREPTEDLLDKYSQGVCTAEEKALVESWFLHWKADGVSPSAARIERANREVMRSILAEVPVKKINRNRQLAGIAAAILLLLGISVLLFREGPLSKAYRNDIGPGGNKATLTLSNGKVIPLSSTKTGVVIEGDHLTYNDGTVLASPQNMVLNEVQVSTPLGGTYQVSLPDGTRVWLNAGSTLKFPSSFADLKERIVRLSGEAYFEVARIKSPQGIKFIVKTAQQEVSVLGTHFNINSYADEPNTKTTLLEGSVRLSVPLLQNGGTILKPGEQGFNEGQRIEVSKVEAEEVIAWKNGEFAFSNERLESIMRKIARWYDVTVVYENKNVGNVPFGGSISRFGKVSEVLDMLELTGKVKFKVEGRRITVN
ncbi:FecR family protein [Pedobacter heparinus]|uniref:FecR protein n=1 Tax=Pedobacter heparinus (strain ATCC 13125 / DSM 2366 / CIP 104194 / JCM 7457 / NBRC 12017 / NCIMB 9290 / NRRL B-14731 / HIM 762-3) TaxID=485917 RepID=C6XVV6_PEDHD|nr:FecR family protein [Pedobacter heparinus]ACU06181.1 FecR protein [Pedobacter heparinus DSM 2366]